MTEVSLPNKSRTKKDPVLFADAYENDVALKEVIEGELTTENLAANAGVKRAQLEAAARGVGGAWYTPKVIATEESRSNSAFGTLTTADEIKEVVLPENGLMVVGYQAKIKHSVAAAGKAAIFLGANQIKGFISGGAPVVLEGGPSTINVFYHCCSDPTGLNFATENAGSDVTTGQALANSLSSSGGVCHIFAAAGTYDLSIKFKAASGSVTAKERKLWCYVLGT